jgi:hypothetical protein
MQWSTIALYCALLSMVLPSIAVIEVQYSFRECDETTSFPQVLGGPSGAPNCTIDRDLDGTDLGTSSLSSCEHGVSQISIYNGAECGGVALYTHAQLTRTCINLGLQSRAYFCNQSDYETWTVDLPVAVPPVLTQGPTYPVTDYPHCADTGCNSILWATYYTDENCATAHHSVEILSSGVFLEETCYSSAGEQDYNIKYQCTQDVSFTSLRYQSACNDTPYETTSQYLPRCLFNSFSAGTNYIKYNCNPSSVAPIAPPPTTTPQPIDSPHASPNGSPPTNTPTVGATPPSSTSDAASRSLLAELTVLLIAFTTVITCL